ncbi:hypothetical protein B0T14DRAFT_599000 [Immersiella caudata]|uniref:Uncharacterized protein n=1 Tax=Immersiella caudata TaxID=314043 RepID=A0AA40CCI7_9PEZI|nr:hypothetical protein B0T14DRAFT_599000 [Immersiella caudata]
MEDQARSQAGSETQTGQKQGPTEQEAKEIAHYRASRKRNIAIQTLLTLLIISIAALYAFLIVGCFSGTVIGLSDIYLLQFALPACNATVNVHYYAICAGRTDEPYPNPWCSDAMLYGQNRGRIHEKLFGYRPENATRNPLVKHPRECPLGELAVDAAMDFQEKIVLSVETGAAGLFVLGMLLLWLWNSGIKYPVWRARCTTEGKFPAFTQEQEIASALVYATTKWGGVMEVRMGQRVWMMHWAIVGLQVMLLAGLFYCTRTELLTNKWDTAERARGDKVPDGFWRANKWEWPGLVASPDTPVEAEPTGSETSTGSKGPVTFNIGCDHNTHKPTPR